MLTVEYSSVQALKLIKSVMITINELFDRKARIQAYGSGPSLIRSRRRELALGNYDRPDRIPDNRLVSIYRNDLEMKFITGLGLFR